MQCTKQILDTQKPFTSLISPNHLLRDARFFGVLSAACLLTQLHYSCYEMRLMATMFRLQDIKYNSFLTYIGLSCSGAHWKFKKILSLVEIHLLSVTFGIEQYN